MVVCGHSGPQTGTSVWRTTGRLLQLCEQESDTVTILSCRAFIAGDFWEAEQPLSVGCMADRLRHADQYEHKWGHRQPCYWDVWWKAWLKNSCASQWPCQYEPGLMMMMIIILIILVVVVVPYTCGGVGGVRVLQGTYRFICTSTTPDHIPFPF